MVLLTKQNSNLKLVTTDKHRELDLTNKSKILTVKKSEKQVQYFPLMTQQIVRSKGCVMQYKGMTLRFKGKIHGFQEKQIIALS